MVDSKFLNVFLPYCLDKQADGSWVVLNRRYKPVGLTPTEWVKYEDFPVSVGIKGGISDKLKAALSFNGNVESTRIYLYNDATNPLINGEAWAAYAKRLALLAELTVQH